MYQNKIEKFTDRFLTKPKASRLSRKKFNSSLPSNSRGFEFTGDFEQFNYSSNMERFGFQKKQLGMPRTDIDKLQLMCADLTAEDYLNKLIQIHSEQKVIINEGDLITVPKQSYNVQQMKSEKQDGQDDCSFKTLTIESNEYGDFYKYQAPLCDKKEISKFKFKSNQCYNRHRDDKSRDKHLLGSNMSKNRKIQTEQSSKQIIKEKQIRQINFMSNQQKKPTFIDTINQNQNKVLDEDKQLNSNQSKALTKDPLIFQQQQHKGKQLQEICYAEIGKRMVIVTQKQIRRQFFQTNLHIRAYLMRNIVQYIKYKAEFSPYSIFILPNQRALHFQPNQKPEELNPYVQHTRYVQIIRNVNHIIQKNIFKQKYQAQVKNYWPYGMLVMLFLIVIMIMLLAFVGYQERTSTNQQYINSIIMIFTGLLICLFLVILIGYSLHCYSAKIKFRPVCEKVYEDIDSYFKYINGKMENNLQWIIGNSFFWVEVKIHPYCRSESKSEAPLLKKKNMNEYYMQYLEEQLNSPIR